jgi:outer membrane protein assembly factor BamB
MTWTNRATRASVVAAATVALTLAAQAAAGTKTQDWPQFRGQHRDGVSAETGLLKSWPAAGPREAWRRPVGEGYSGISIVGDRLYTMYAGEQNGEQIEFAAASDAATGKEIWRVPVGKYYVNEFGNGPRSTPTVDGDTVYVLGSVGNLMALATKDGAERWKIVVPEAFGGKVPYFGFAGSVLADGGQILVEVGGTEGKWFAALDAKTGATRWTSGNGPVGYNSPLPVDLKSGRSYVHVGRDKVYGLDAAGKTLWTYPWPNGETHAIPIFVPPDKVLISGVEGIGATLLQIGDGPSGPTATEVWKNPTFRTHFNAAVLRGDHIYGFDNATLKCISLKDGSLAWSKRGLGKGSLVQADEMLVILSDEGKLVLAEATPTAYVEKGSVQALTGRCWTPPTLAGGRIFVRNHAEMVSYELKG